MMPQQKSIGLVLGSGSARGWAHIGVIHELIALGIRPDVVCGTSIGALVGAAYANGKLDSLESWVLGITARNLVQYLDLRLVVGGGFVEGKRLMSFFKRRFGDVLIQQLPIRFGSVATDLITGEELWLTAGPLWDAVRASIAFPGIVTPANLNGQWLVDGGLVNPVPVSLCRGLGAETVIAVNLNGDIVGKHFVEREKRNTNRNKAVVSTEAKFLERFTIRLRRKMNAATPGLFDVLAGSINIMQDRITQSRLASTAPDVVIAPKLAHIGLMELDRAHEAIQEGRACVHSMIPALKQTLHLP